MLNFVQFISGVVNICFHLGIALAQIVIDNGRCRPQALVKLYGMAHMLTNTCLTVAAEGSVNLRRTIDQEITKQRKRINVQLLELNYVLLDHHS